jgi:hypothetical protein
MSIEELEDLAFRGEPMPDLRSQADMLAFLSFRNLYDFAKRVQMPPEQGKREKAQIAEAHKINKFLENLQEDTNLMWKRIEIAAAAYCKVPSIKTADELYKAIYRAERKRALA